MKQSGRARAGARLVVLAVGGAEELLLVLLGVHLAEAELALLVVHLLLLLALLGRGLGAQCSRRR